MNYPSSINSNVRMNKTMFSSNLTLEEIPHRDHKLRNIAKVENMKSNRSGKPIANQFVITDDNGNEFFQSYNSMIVKKDSSADTIYLDQKYWNYSNTTGKYRNIFLNETIKDTKAKIKSGEYILTDLNK